MFVLPFSFVLWRRWQLPDYALIWLLYSTLKCHQRHGGLVTQYWQQLLKGTKKRLIHENWRSVAVELTLAASYLESPHISWSNYYGALLSGRWGDKLLGWWRNLLNLVLHLGLVQRAAYRKASKWTDSIFTAHLDLCFI